MVEGALGPERLNRFQPWHSLEKAGVTVSFGSDWCAGPMNPVLGFLIAGLRINYHGNSKWGRDEKITTRSILQHYTLDCARALKWDKEIGSLEVGKYGDFAIYSENLLDMTSWWFLLTHDLKPDKLDDFVFLTVVGGEVVYHRPGARF
jgi:predicted amidohydrolase YtcJ